MVCNERTKKNSSTEKPSKRRCTPCPWRDRANRSTETQATPDLVVPVVAVVVATAAEELAKDLSLRISATAVINGPDLQTVCFYLITRQVFVTLSIRFVYKCLFARFMHFTCTCS